MERRRLGNTDMEVSALGFGGSELGFQKATQRTTDALLHAALDAGLNVIDTAAAYLSSEEMIGRATSGRRHQFYLMTKCGFFDGFKKQDWSAAGIQKTIQESLRRLRTEYLDVVFLHSCGEEELRRGDAVEGLRRARDKGMVRYLGYSGDGAAGKAAVESGAFDVLQTSISIADQEAIDLLLPPARARNLGVVAKRPIANAAWRYAEKPADDYHVTYWQRFGALRYPFLDGAITEAAAIALRFTVYLPGVHTAIVGTTKPGRWEENAEVVRRGPLPAEQVAAIRARWREVAQADWVGQM